MDDPRHGARPPGEPAKGTSSKRTKPEPWLRAVAHVSEVNPHPPAPPLVPGQVILDERFRILELLGRGGMGAVYAAEDRLHGGRVALKTLFRTEADRVLRLKHEFRGLRDLSHPNLVELYELFRDGHRWFFTMERVEGNDLLSWVRPAGVEECDEHRLRQVLHQLVHGLSALHRAGKVHRDIKPSNTLVEASSGRVVLVDFGLAAELGAPFGAREVVGTAAYMAPEQCVGGPPSQAADWYGVGVMLFEALTGRLPFQGSTADLLDPRRRSPVPAPTEWARHLPADLSALCRDLLSPDPAQRPDGTEVRRRLRSLPSATQPLAPMDGVDVPFVGRSAALEALHQSLADTRRTGAPTLVHVQGESGIGKTSLLHRFARAAGDEALVLQGRCHQREHVSYRTLDGVVDSLARFLATLPRAQRARLQPARWGALTRLFPVLAEHDGTPPTGTTSEQADPVAFRREAFKTLRELLCRVAESQLLVLIVDDVQWADPDSFVGLHALLGGPEAPPLLCVLASRRGWQAAPVEALPITARTLALGPLPKEDAADLVQAMGVASDQDVHRIVAAAHGHPLFLAELARHADEGEAAPQLDEAIVRRVDALDQDERRLLELITTAARPLTPTVLAEAAGMPLEALAANVRRIELQRLLRFNAEGVRVEPYHDWIRHAVARHLPADSSTEHHARLARAMEVHEPAAAEVLAEHWSAAGDAQRALRHAVRAAEQARNALAFERAARLFQWALELGGADGPDTGRLLRERGDALANAGRGREAAEAYEQAATVASGNDATDLHRLAAEQLLRAGHVDEGMSAMDGVLAQLGMRYPRTRAGAVGQMAGELLRLAVTRQPPRSSAPSVEVLRQLDTCWAVAVGLTQLEPLTGAVFQARFLRLARQLGEPSRIALGLCMAAIPAGSAGPPARRARRLLDEAGELAERCNDPRVRAYLAFAETQVAFLNARWDEALHHGEQTVEAFRACTGVAWEVATAQRLALDCLWHTGRIADLDRQVWRVVQDARDRGDRYALTQLQTTVLPIVRLAADNPMPAARELDEALASWTRAGFFLQHWQHMQTHAVVLMYQGRFGEALAFSDARMAQIGRTFLFRIQAIRIFTRFVQGTAAVGAAMGKTGGQRRALLRRAAHEARGLRREGLGQPYATLLRAQIAEVGNQPDATLRYLATAEHELGLRGTRLHQAIIVRALGKRLGGDEGRDLDRRARGWISGQPIQRPDRFFQTIVPAFATD